jgi:hypothetical protein
MEDRELIECLAAEIENACAHGDDVRAGKLADLQLEAIARMSREIATDPLSDRLASAPLVRTVPQHGQIEPLGERHQLELLRWHWGSGYAVTLGHDGWRAERRDGGTILIAPTAGQLRHRILEDIATRPAPRRSRHHE